MSTVKLVLLGSLTLFLLFVGVFVGMEDGIIDVSHWITERENWSALVTTMPTWSDATELIKGVVDIS
mgnify:CR=1 FL=1